MTQPTFEQRNFRFRNDDGGEVAPPTGATWAEDINIDHTHGTGTANRRRLRFDVLNDSTATDAPSPFSYEYSYEGGGWAPITTSSSYIQAYDTANLTDGDDCTNIIGSGDFITDNNGQDETGSFSVTSFVKADFIETELSYYLVDADVNHNDTIDVRIVSDDGHTVTYTVAPRITVLKGTSTSDSQSAYTHGGVNVTDNQ